ncbi:MAG: hypothetical protein ACM3PE_09795 [Deltaproteobacteria bacterium]
MPDSYAMVADILDLSDSVIQAMEHLQVRLTEGHLEDSSYLLEDLKDAVTSIQNATELLMPHLGENMINDLTLELQGVVEEMTATYEQRRIEKAKVDMQWLMLPLAKKWRDELGRCLTAFKAS